MHSKATTVDAYLASLPEDRREAIRAVRKIILDNLDPEFEEHMAWGMIGYCVPHRLFAQGYHCDPEQPLPFAGLASQKNHMSIHVMSAYGGSDTDKWLRAAWAKSGKKLDMGKCCIRFKRLDDLPLDVVGQLFARTSAREWIAYYSAVLDQRKVEKAAAKRPAATTAGGANVKAPAAKALSTKARSAKSRSSKTQAREARPAKSAARARGKAPARARRS